MQPMKIRQPANTISAEICGEITHDFRKEAKVNSDTLRFVLGCGNFGVKLEIVHWLWIGVAALSLVAFKIFWTQFTKHKHFEIVSFNVPFGLGSTVQIKPNHEIAQIAHRAWVELITRKVGLPFDEQHDVIVECYNSWYEMFREFRLLIKSIPAAQLRSSDDARKLVDLMVQVLNEGLRPHLTQWQARFRTWYDAELRKNPDKSPQDLQREYLHYDQLIADFKLVNQIMIDFKANLSKLARGKT
jgi:hypothetical protein